MFHMNLFQHLFNSWEKYIFIDNQQPKQIDFREPLEIRSVYISWMFYSIILNIGLKRQMKKMQKCKIYVTKKQKRLRPVYL